LFVAQAHSFTQQARLAITLAWVAGYTNVVAILACGHVASHVSGTTSDLGHHFVEALRGRGTPWSVVGSGLLLVGTFFVGAMVSGFATEFGRRRNWESIYVLPMAIQSALLALFAIGLEVVLLREAPSKLSQSLLASLASMAMGVQNATITRISSGVVRTTHVTGVVTDLGLELVQFLWPHKSSAHQPHLQDHPPHAPRGTIHADSGAHPEVAHASRWKRLSPSARRLTLLLSIIGSFALGAALGTLGHEEIPSFAMYVPVLFLVWIIYQDISRPIAEIEPSTLIEDRALMLPEGMLIYHVRPDKGREKGTQRLPNLLSWSERLPDDAKVIILDLTDVTQLDANAAYDLRAALDRLEIQGRRLVVAGVTRDQFEQLRKAGAGERLDPNSACPDLELAIARGMALLG
jgi:uncharacterized membrane protein YoaK (UPF0700 family)